MGKRAKLYRMATEEHLCPFGLKSKDLLEREGFNVDDHQLKTREEIERFKSRLDVDTTPQIFIEEQQIGGYEELRTFLGKPEKSESGITYTPVLAIFGLAALMVTALVYSDRISLSPASVILHFVAFSMVMLALQKLQDLSAFSNQFITYDLLAMRHIRYAYIYPFAEAWVGLGMLAQLSALWVAPVSLFIGTIGALSVIKAVYIDKRELKCACVGGDSNVPLGFISLSENLFMMGAGFWMLYRFV